MKLISVIIATYNRAPDLEKVIKGLLAQELPGSFDYEMIIIDNGSTDNTENTVKDLMEHAKGRLNYFRQSTPGKSNALNMGIAHAKGEIIAFTDDDVTVEKNWLSSIAASFDLYRCDGIGEGCCRSIQRIHPPGSVKILFRWQELWLSTTKEIPPTRLILQWNALLGPIGRLKAVFLKNAAFSGPTSGLEHP